MLSDLSSPLQDKFLDKICSEKAEVTLFLVNGVKLHGVITWYDPYSVLLRRDRHAQLVYKHAISTILPLNPVSYYQEEKLT